MRYQGAEKTGLDLRPQRLVRALASLALAFGGIVVGLGPGTLPTVHAVSPPPFTGTSELSYMLASVAPTGAAGIVGRHREVSQWSLDDSSHWRLDAHITEPALESHDETVVANGGSLI